ncbi:MAG: hypothetical protein WEB00_03425 [Dehalococcoidia bacterium]
MPRLALLAFAALLLAACSGTSLPGGDNGESADTPIDSEARSLLPGEVGPAVRQLTSALAELQSRRRELLLAFEADSAESSTPAADGAFRAVISREFEVARLAALLQLSSQANLRGELGETATAAFGGLALAALIEALGVNDIRGRLDLGQLTVGQAGEDLATGFERLAPPAGDSIALLPPDGTELTLGLAFAGTEPVTVSEEVALFADVIAAQQPATLESILAGQDVEPEQVDIRARTLVALLGSAGTTAPASPFGAYSMSVTVPEEMIYSLSAQSTVGVLNQRDATILVLQAEEGGVARLGSYQVVTATGLPALDLVGEAALDGVTTNLPSIGRPLAGLVQARSRYVVELAMQFVDPAGLTLTATCLVPAVGARITLVGEEADLGAFAGLAELTLAASQLEALAEFPQVLCVDSYGTLETGRVGVPPELLPPDDDGVER